MACKVCMHCSGIGEQGGSAGNPRILKALSGVHFARVACGTNHSLALTSGGQVHFPAFIQPIQNRDVGGVRY